MKGAIVVRWGTPARGREGKALEVLHSALDFHDRLAEEGQIDRASSFVSTTEISGMAILEGDFDQLHKIQSSQECQQLQIQAATNVDNFSVHFVAGGTAEGAREPLAMYGHLLTQMGLK